ncbi:MAG: hypothetical protein AAB343_01960 [Patescibacteria group bacterium]
MRILLGKIAVVAAASAFGALGMIGCALAVYFEFSGFGGGRDTEPRLIYLVLLGVGFVACLGVPAFLWHRFFPGIRAAWIIAFVVVVIGVATLMGISIAGT